MSATTVGSEGSVSLGPSTATSPARTPEYGDPYSQPLPSNPNSATEVVAKLSNYVPLGCLCCEDFSTAAIDEPDTWREVTTPLFLAFDTATSAHLARLLQHGWIRIQSARCQLNRSMVIFRIYLLFWDVGKSSIERSNKQLISAVQSLVGEVDVSSATWNGCYDAAQQSKFDPWATRDEDDSSLFYLFNKLPSPDPAPSDIKEKYAREALEDLLDCSYNPPGLKTALYPYQRRSAGAMLLRESVPRHQLDPRIEERTAPDGSRYFYKPREVQFLRDPEYCESCRGGILAETMGLGKTVICLSLILSTKGHPPKIPVQYATQKSRPSVASLADMAVAAINMQSIPWGVEFDRIRQATGHEMSSCTQRLIESPPSYDIPVIRQRWNRATTQPPPQRMILAATTLIVVPQNLCKQWQSEIQKHVTADTLKILVMDQSKKPLPPKDELRDYDVILFTRNRFDQESTHGKDSEGRSPSRVPTSCQCSYIGATRKRDCRCLTKDMLYDSPLKHLHFKRLIVDEGHFFSSSNSNTTLVANRIITADHKWSVSGTPARDLLGVEVDVTALSEDSTRQDILEQRRRFSMKEDKSGAIESLGALASGFLKVLPWSNFAVSWRDHVFRHEDRRYTYSGFSTCLRRTLEDLVIKTRPEDVEKDIDLPPLHHKIVRLQPSFYDKLSANMFALVLTANAVTSERTDADYLFHKNSHKERYQLVSNLRQSAFFWTGFAESDVNASIKISTGYLEKEGTNCSAEDRELLSDALSCTKDLLASDGWKSMSRCHELGFFVDDWPRESAEHWSFDASRQPLLTGISQLLQAQQYVNSRLAEVDPGEGLSGAGIHALMSARNTGQKADNDAALSAPTKTQKLMQKGLPASSIEGEPDLRRRSTISKGSSSLKQSFRISKARSETKSSRRSSGTLKKNGDHQNYGVQDMPQGALDTDSQYAKARIVGTTSAKLSYLLTQVLKYYEHEKILIFYSGDNIAYYIAQALDLLGVKHEIYAKSLQQRLKSEYIVKFDQGTDDRVLLMDVGQAAFGLNLSSASRIFFVNPVCRPNVEAQAVKRAHRIGQSREVFVETLVLKDTIEEKMLERSKRMTADEHREAGHLEDDGGIREIIQSAHTMPLTEDERSARGQMAPLEEPQQLWGRPGSCSLNAKARKRKRRPTLQDSTDHDGPPQIIHEEENPQVVPKKRQTDAAVGTAASSGSASFSADPWLQNFRPSALPRILSLPSMGGG